MCRRKQLNKYERAAFLVKNALHGRRVALPTPGSIWAQRIYHHTAYRLAYACCAGVAMLLAVWEPPADAQPPPAGLAVVRAIDAAFMAWVALDLYLQTRYHGVETCCRRGWTVIKGVVLALMAVNFVLHLAVPQLPYVARALRPLLLIERLRNVRRVASNIASTLPKIFNVVILLALHILFFSVLGFVLFAGLDGVQCRFGVSRGGRECSTFNNEPNAPDNCDDFFGTLDNSAIQLFQLLTAANFPAIALPTYTCYRGTMLYFLAFIVIGIYLLLNLTLAVTYATFKSLMADEVVQKYSRMFEGFDLAFQELTMPNLATMRADSVDAWELDRRQAGWGGWAGAWRRRYLGGGAGAGAANETSSADGRGSEASARATASALNPMAAAAMPAAGGGDGTPPGGSTPSGPSREGSFTMLATMMREGSFTRFLGMGPVPALTAGDGESGDRAGAVGGAGIGGVVAPGIDGAPDAMFSVVPPLPGAVSSAPTTGAPATIGGWRSRGGSFLRVDDEDVGITLKRADFIRFFACLRPDVDGDCAGKLFDVFDGDRQGEIFMIEFRRLILNFGRLRIKSAARGAAPSTPRRLAAVVSFFSGSSPGTHVGSANEPGGSDWGGTAAVAASTSPGSAAPTPAASSAVRNPLAAATAAAASSPAPANGVSRVVVELPGLSGGSRSAGLTTPPAAPARRAATMRALGGDTALDVSDIGDEDEDEIEVLEPAMLREAALVHGQGRRSGSVGRAPPMAALDAYAMPPSSMLSTITELDESTEADAELAASRPPSYHGSTPTALRQTSSSRLDIGSGSHSPSTPGAPTSSGARGAGFSISAALSPPPPPPPPPLVAGSLHAVGPMPRPPPLPGVARQGSGTSLRIAVQQAHLAGSGGPRSAPAGGGDAAPPSPLSLGGATPNLTSSPDVGAFSALRLASAQDDGAAAAHAVRPRVAPLAPAALSPPRGAGGDEKAAASRAGAAAAMARPTGVATASALPGETNRASRPQLRRRLPGRHETSVWSKLGAAVAAGLSTSSTADGYGLAASSAASSRRLLPAHVTADSWRGWAMVHLQGMWLTLLFDAVVLLNSVAVIIELNVSPDDVVTSPTGIAMRQLQYACLALFALEIALKLVVWRPVPYWRESHFNKVDLVLVASAVIGTVLQATGVLDRQVSVVISFFRFVRLVRILRVIPGFGLTIAAFADILPVLVQYGTVLFCSFYLFAIAGMTAFQGVLTESNPAVRLSSYGGGRLYALNYDSLAGAFTCQLYLLVQNDWPMLMEGTVAALGKGARIYFFAFWLTHLVLVLNVLVAFVIDSFSTQKMKRETLRAMQGVAGGEEGQMRRIGVEDWRDLVIRSGIDFSAYRISRKAHHFDVYDELYKEEVRSKFAKTFSTRRRGSSLPVPDFGGSGAGAGAGAGVSHALHATSLSRLG